MRMVMARAGALLLLGASACTNDRQTVVVSPGDPVPGLSAEELSRFQAGQALFDKVYTPEEGVGPFLNENQCSACHTDPASGGTGEQVVVRFAALRDGSCDPLLDLGGGNVRGRTTPNLSTLGVLREEVPPQANRTGRFKVPFLFGLGLAEALPEAVLVALADPDDADADGISGRLPRLPDGRAARFGSKGEFASIRDFTVGALRAEMGLTTPDLPEELVAGGQTLPPGADPVPEPEVGAAAVDLLTDYVAMLAPIQPRRPDDAEAMREIERGERLFAEVGCSSCHVPELTTGVHPIAALSQRPARLYSDFLLHDLGPELADVCGAGAGPAELRTMPLAGLRYRNVYLHDGRVGRLHDAIVLHGGEGAPARDRFLELDDLARFAVVSFLESL